MSQERKTSSKEEVMSDEPCCDDISCCPPQKPVIRMFPKIGRNDACPCDSGRKYKKCCGKYG